MSNGPIRRSQLIAPFGVGAMTTVPNGTSLITGGLDYWYSGDEGDENTIGIDVDEFKLEEWRLQKRLHVDHFRLPPDWRIPQVGRGAGTNLRLSVPFLRFPTWNLCANAKCRSLSESPLSFKGIRRCHHCASENNKGGWRVSQVTTVAVCDYGHLQDFPWREWVHRSILPTCSGRIKLFSTGGTSLISQRLECDCGSTRSLAGVNNSSAGRDSTVLSDSLDDLGRQYLCEGAKPWNGDLSGDYCGRKLSGSTRTASNIYYAMTRSSIYLPRNLKTVSEDLIQHLVTNPIVAFLDILRDVASEITPDLISPVKSAFPDILKGYTDVEIYEALLQIEKSGADLDGDTQNDPEEWDETEFRRAEYQVLSDPISTPMLQIASEKISDYDSPVSDLFDSVMLVNKLRETRALYGFTRIFPEGQGLLSDRKNFLRRDPPNGPDWLPAYVVHGEGIFFRVKLDQLTDWAYTSSVMDRAGSLMHKYEELSEERGMQEKVISPQFILLHTLSHVLMNTLTFECGYSSSALRERIYVASGEAQMAGLMIYTAAGDAEGTMGGLVRMGKPGYLEPVVKAAIDAAKWCSADPVCMELGATGQGPDSLNLAACHNCMLVPETACEEFNRFLDRGLLVGIPSKPDIGFIEHSL